MSEGVRTGGGDDSGLIPKVRDVLKRVRDAAEAYGDDAAWHASVLDVSAGLRGTTGEFGDVELNIAANRILLGEDAVYKSDARENNLAFELFRQGLRRVTFKAGITEEECSTFLSCFVACRAVEASDEDFISTLWRESLPGILYVAIDGFTEKIFMADERFTAAFRAIVDDVMPGLVDMSEEDEADAQPRARETLDDRARVDAVAEADAELVRALAVGADAARKRINDAAERDAIYEHLLRLMGCVAAKHPTPLAPQRLGAAAARLLSGFIEAAAWSQFADAARTLLTVGQAGDTLSADLAENLEAMRYAAAGKGTLSSLAAHFDPTQTDFTAWARWHFVTAAAVAAPDLLALINTCSHAPGTEFLKDLLRRQSTDALEPWAERLRDDDPAVVLEVLDVILGSDLGQQARPLLIETLSHPAPKVRAVAIDGLAGDYDKDLRQALLPLLRDPASEVRRAVVRRFAAARDRSVATYLASTIRAPMFFEFDEDEQRLFFESLSRLGGDRFIDVYREQLRMGESEGRLAKLFRRGAEALADDPIRRSALAGLAMIASPQAVALIHEVQKKASLELASHCEVALRMAARGGVSQRTKDLDDASRPKPQRSPAELEAGRTRMGERVVFEVKALAGEPPKRALPSPVDRAQARPAATRSVADAVAGEDEPAAPPVAIGEMPLLRADEVFLPADERRLKAEPALSEGPRFRLSGVRARLVGVPTASERAIDLTPPPPDIAARVFERKSTAVHEDWSHQPDATLDDILASYLDEVAAAAAAEPMRGERDTVPARPPAPPDTRPPPDLPPPVERTAPERAFADPVPDDDSRAAHDTVPQMSVPPPDLPPAPDEEVPALDEDAPAPEKSAGAVDDLLRQYLDLDLDG